MGNQWDLLIVVLNTEPSTIGGTEQKGEGCVFTFSTPRSRTDFQSATGSAALSVEIVFIRKLFAILLEG